MGRRAIAILSLCVCFSSQREARAQLPGSGNSARPCRRRAPKLLPSELGGKHLCLGRLRKRWRPRRRVRPERILAQARRAAEGATPRRRRRHKRQNLRHRRLHLRYRIRRYRLRIRFSRRSVERQKPRCQRRAARLAVGAIAERFSAIGGVGANGKNTNVNEEYDPAQDRWTKRAPLPTPRDHHAIGVVQRQALRHRRAHQRPPRSPALPTTRNTIRQPIAGKLLRPLPTVRSGISAASLDGKIFVFGGETTRGTHKEVESYDPAQNRWQRWAPMPTARHGLGVAVLGQSIYVIAGGPKPGATFSSVNEMFTP